MSTLKVTNIQSPSTTSGGLSIDSTGAVSGALPSPNRNLLYNGAMQVAQRGTSSTGITTSGYRTADRWTSYFNSLGTWTESIESDGPSSAGVAKSLKFLCTTANASPTAGAYAAVEQKLEGQDLQRVAKGTASARELTLSFWVKSNVTGTYVVWFFDTDNARQVSATYTVNASATWEQKSITFPADTTGAWANDNATSVRLFFMLAAGSNFTSGTLATTWATAVDANAAVGQTNLAAAVNNYWQITGVQLEVGDTATGFEHKPYGVELAECQRYYYMHTYPGGGFIGMFSHYSNTSGNAGVHFPVTMRSTPTLSAASGTDYFTIARNSGSDNINSLNISYAGVNGCTVYNSTEVSGTAGQVGVLATNNAAAYVAFNAEL